MNALFQAVDRHPVLAVVGLVCVVVSIIAVAVWFIEGATDELRRQELEDLAR